MNPGMPQFHLFIETGLNPALENNCPWCDGRSRMASTCEPNQQNASALLSGAWRFILRSVDGAKYFEAADVETEVFGERLDLLTLVRALESLDQPSRVTLIGCTNYIRQGIQFGMPEWRTNDWLWEWFGQMVPVKNADLWQRLDRLIAFHQVECRMRRIDAGHPTVPEPNYLVPREEPANRVSAVAKAWTAKAWNRLPVAVRERIGAYEGNLRRIAFASAKAMQAAWNRIERAGRKMQNSSIPGSA